MKQEKTVEPVSMADKFAADVMLGYLELLEYGGPGTSLTTGAIQIKGNWTPKGLASMRRVCLGVKNAPLKPSIWVDRVPKKGGKAIAEIEP